jgi:hypothetical protein
MFHVCWHDLKDFCKRGDERIHEKNKYSFAFAVISLTD